MKSIFQRLEVLTIVGFLSAGMCQAQTQETEVQESGAQNSRRVQVQRRAVISDTDATGMGYGVRQNQDLLDQSVQYLTGRPLEVISARKQAHPLILSEMATDPNKYDQMVEDLNIMARILNKTLMGITGRDRRDMVMGIIVSSISDQPDFQSLYLDGFGALFLLRVDFPLVPPAKEPVEETARPTTSETWEQAKRELYAPSQPGRYVERLQRIVGREEKQYDADRVERLKTDLLESLKNATNIRNLKPDDRVQVVVLAERAGSGNDEDEASDSRRSAMILRVSKKDADSFANNELSADEFIANATTLIY